MLAKSDILMLPLLSIGRYVIRKPWFDKYKNVVWLKPQLVGTAHFMQETENGGMRQPVWKGLREDK